MQITALLARFKRVETRDKLLGLVILMQVLTLYFAFSAYGESSQASSLSWDAVDYAKDATRSCSSLAYDLSSVKEEAREAASYARKAATVCTP